MPASKALEWADLDLDTGTIQFRQALTVIDLTVLPAAAAPWRQRR
jgi:hypothetical protein